MNCVRRGTVLEGPAAPTAQASSAAPSPGLWIGGQQAFFYSFLFEEGSFLFVPLGISGGEFLQRVVVVPGI